VERFSRKEKRAAVADSPPRNSFGSRESQEFMGNLLIAMVPFSFFAFFSFFFAIWIAPEAFLSPMCRAGLCLGQDKTSVNNLHDRKSPGFLQLLALLQGLSLFRHLVSLHGSPSRISSCFRLEPNQSLREHFPASVMVFLSFLDFFNAFLAI
jgi:hypothetical protein